MPVDHLLLAQSIKITNWLTPVWIMSIGISIGYLLVLLLLLKIWLCQRIPGINAVTEKTMSRWIVGLLTSAAYLALFIAFLYWISRGTLRFDSNLILPLSFAVPICLLAGFGIWNVMSRRMRGEMSDLIFDGFLSWVNKVCWIALAFALLGFGLAATNGFGIVKFVDEPMGIVKSFVRLPWMGSFQREFDIPGSTEGNTGEKLPISFDGAELQALIFECDNRLEAASMEITPGMPPNRLLVVDTVAGEPSIYVQRPDGSGAFPAEPIGGIYVKNLGKNATKLKVTWDLVPVFREVIVIPMFVIVTVAIYMSYLIFVSLFPKIGAIAFSTFKTEAGQPLFLLVMGMTMAFLLGTIFVPYNTFGEDIKMYKDSGLNLIRVLAIFLAIWAASKSVAEEIEGRTALTVLSKPVGRRQFVFGKFTGISLAIAVMFIVVGLWFYIWVAYKPVYDNQESSKGIAEWSECFLEAINVMPGLFLCFLEVIIFVAISVAISTRFGILANFLICFSIYVLGHLTPLLVQSSLGAFETVAVFGRLVAIVFPVLDHFDVQAAINNNTTVPTEYIAWAVIYTGLYSSMAMLVALVLFEDRDLA